MDATVQVILVLVGAVVVGVAMLALLGWLFRKAVESTNLIATGFMVLVVVAVIGAYGRALAYVVLNRL